MFEAVSRNVHFSKYPKADAKLRRGMVWDATTLGQK